MRHLVTILFLAAFSVGAMAQEKGIPLLDKAAGYRVQFHYTYSLSQDGAAFKEVTDGDVIVEDNAYILEGLGLRVVSNGVTRWSVDAAAGEAVIENVEKEDLFTNPALFLSSYRKYMDSIRVNAQGPDSLDVTLMLEDQNQARFILRDIVFAEAQGKSDFSVDEKSLSKDYVITDLR